MPAGAASPASGGTKKAGAGADRGPALSLGSAQLEPAAERTLLECTINGLRARVLVDTGATTEFMSERFARRGGFARTDGNFGYVREAFGQQTSLTQQVQGAQVSMQGEVAGSGVRQSFEAPLNFILVPQMDVDAILGHSGLSR